MNYCPIEIEIRPKWHSVPVLQKSSGAVAIPVQSAPSLDRLEKGVRPFWVPIPVTDELAEYN